MSSYPPQPPPITPPLSMPPPPQPQTWSPAPPPPPAAAPASDLTRSYAQWFDWASTQYGDDRHAHLATQAAVAALQGGADATAAVAAGQQAANAPDAATQQLTADQPTQAYAAWYAWARHKIGLDPQRAHLAAVAGRGAQASGAPVSTAQAHAMAAAGVGPSPVGSSTMGGAGAGSVLAGLSWRDPALRAIIYGVVCLIVPFFGWVFWILPILGLIYSIRALTQSRFVLGVIGVVVNLLACALTGAVLLGWL